MKVNGEQRYLWRAVDHEGEVLETVVTKRRDKRAALKLLKKLMKRFGAPREIVTDLHPVPEIVIDDRIMLAEPDLLLVPDQPAIDRVGEDLVDLTPAMRTR